MDADVEDKTCRICGFVDTSNINIFDSKWNSLLTKILTVFPIIIYETDPLPKNICRKCVTNVSLMYDETCKLFKVQKKWIDNVRQNQPNHPYFKIIDLIKTSNQKMMTDVRKIETNFPHRDPRIYPNWFNSNEDTKEGVIAPTASSSSGLSFTKTKFSNEDFALKKKEFQKKIDPSSPAFSLFKSKEITIGPKKIMPFEKLPNSSIVKPAITDQIKELQHKLQSNGCTLMSLSAGNKQRSPIPHFAKFGEKCKYCNAVFSNVQFLAKHQLSHMLVTDRRIFDKKFLDKKVRRGRLIPKGDKKCIRCLNCWKLFSDNRGILDHWSNGDCEFFCQICGKEFANNPKMLREHVPAAHGISYKSSRRRSPDSPEFLIDPASIKTEPLSSLSIDFHEDVKVKIEPADDETDYLQNKPPLLSRPKTKKQKGNSKCNTWVKCNLCGVVFSNFRSKNSHMRKHKNRNPIIPKVEPPTEFTIKQEKEEPVDEESMQFDESETNSQINNSEDKDEKPRLQVKKLSDLQDPSVSSQHSDEDQNIKEESNDQSAEQINTTQDHMEYGKIYNCHPCGKQFSSKTELFEHKRQCQSNNKFACGFCLRAFITSADLQMHIMLMHRDS